MQVAQRDGIGDWCGRRRGGGGDGGGGVIDVDLIPLQRRTAQQARAGVVVVEDDLQRQAHRLVAVARKLHQQTVRLIELEPPVGRGAEFLEVGAFEVVSRHRLRQFGELGFDAVGVELVVGEQAHG
jgi:hypothetical protein